MKINASFLITFFVLITFIGRAQVRVEGKVIDFKTKSPISFATIGIKDKSVGTVGDENGKFSLVIPKDSIGVNEKLIVSAVGYQNAEILVLDFNMGTQEIGLAPAIVLLNEVTVKPLKFKTKTFGRTGRSAFMSTKMISETNHVDDELGKEIGTVIRIDKDCLLKSFKMFVIFNHFKTIKFRLNIYSVKNGLPDSLLVHDNITFDVPQGRQIWSDVDLSRYSIRVEGRDQIAVVIQWLKSVISDDDPKRSFNVAAIPSASNFILFRDKSQAKWLKVGGNMTFNVTADSFSIK